jgi:hypothetical protein
MFFVGEVVKPSGEGRTATWEGMVGTVTRVEGKSVFVQWHNVAVEDELDFEELVSTGTYRSAALASELATFAVVRSHDFFLLTR